MLVSVIIPCYNAENTLLNTVNSCLENDEFLAEIIIVDDFSTDSTFAVAKNLLLKYKKVSIFKNIIKGSNHARNLGFSKATGDYIQWLDADDIILKDKFKFQIQAFQNNKRLDIVYSNWEIYFWDNNNNILNKEFKNEGSRKSMKLELVRDNWITPHCYLIKYSFALELQKLTPWGLETKIAQDREYYTCAALTGANFKYVDGLYAIYNRYFTPSLSRKYNLKERSLYIYNMLNSRSNLFKEALNKDVNNAFETELLLHASRANIHVCNLSFFNIEWWRIGGVRTKLRMLYTLFKSK